MAQLRCPRCATVIALDLDRPPVCPACGFDGPAPAEALAPATWARTDHDTTSGPGQPATTGVGPPARQTDSGAVASMVLGIVGLLMIIPLIPSIIAWVMGAQAVQRCKEDPSLEGLGMAQAGMIMGIIGTALIGLILLFFVLFAAAFASAF